jgi:hypothetical protein
MNLILESYLLSLWERTEVRAIAKRTLTLALSQRERELNIV